MSEWSKYLLTIFFHQYWCEFETPGVNGPRREVDDLPHGVEGPLHGADTPLAPGVDGTHLVGVPTPRRADIPGPPPLVVNTPLPDVQVDSRHVYIKPVTYGKCSDDSRVADTDPVFEMRSENPDQVLKYGGIRSEHQEIHQK